MKSDKEYVSKENETARYLVVNAKQNRNDSDYLKIAK